MGTGETGGKGITGKEGEQNTQKNREAGGKGGQGDFGGPRKQGNKGNRGNMENRVTGETGEQGGQEERGNRGNRETGGTGGRGERENRATKGKEVTGRKGEQGNWRTGIIVVCQGTSLPKIGFDLININIVLTNKRSSLCRVQNGTRNEQQENKDLHYTTKRLAKRKYFTARKVLQITVQSQLKFTVSKIYHKRSLRKQPFLLSPSHPSWSL